MGEKSPEEKKFPTVDLTEDHPIKIDDALQWYEKKYGMSSEKFYARWCQGRIEENFDTNAWASTYEHKLELISGERVR